MKDQGLLPCKKRLPIVLRLTCGPVYITMIKQQLARFNRLELLGGPTPLEKLERLSAWADRDMYVKRDDITPLAMGGNKLRKLEYLAADALAQGCDTLITAGAIQSNHVRQ